MDENQTQINTGGPKAIRTYTSDMAEVIRNNEISVAKIAIEEKQKREEDETYENGRTTTVGKILFFIGGIIFILIAIIGVSYINKKSEEKNIPTISKTSIDTFIVYDELENIDTANITSIEDLVYAISSKDDINKNIIKAINLVKDENGESKTLSIDQFFELTKATIPGALVRSLDNKYLLGEKILNKEVSRFIIFKTNDYNQTYASMLEWEKTLFSDYYPFFNKNISSSSIGSPKWQDIVIDNRDARIIYGGNGEILLCYLFINKDELVITNNLDTLKLIVERILIKK